MQLKKCSQLVFVDTTFSIFYFYIEGFSLQKKCFYSKSSICDKNQEFQMKIFFFCNLSEINL